MRPWHWFGLCALVGCGGANMGAANATELDSLRGRVAALEKQLLAEQRAREALASDLAAARSFFREELIAERPKAEPNADAQRFSFTESEPQEVPWALATENALKHETVPVELAHESRVARVACATVRCLVRVDHDSAAAQLRFEAKSSGTLPHLSERHLLAERSRDGVRSYVYWTREGKVAASPEALDPWK